MLSFRGEIASVNLIPSKGGVFEVTVDEKLIYSKKEKERFPDEDEITQLIKG
jgi:selenoprotein W-related protein